MLKKLFFFTCLLSLVIPRSGTKVGPIPLAISSLLFVLLIGLWFLAEIILKKRLLRTVITGPILLYLGWGAIAFLKGIGSADLVNVARYTAGFVIFPMVFFLMTSYLETQNELRCFLNMILISLLIVSLYGFAQFLLGFQKVTIPGVTMSYSDFFVPDILNLKQNVVAQGPAGQKMFSTFHNGNLFGQHLITFIPIIIMMFFEAKTGLNRVLSLVVGILATGALVCTLSRGAVAGFLTSLMFLFLITMRKHMKIFCIIILLVAVLAGVIFNLKGRFVDEVKLDPTGTRWRNWQERIVLINQLEDKALLKLILFGIGLGGGVVGVEWFYSTYLTIWLDMGIIGLGLFMWIIFNIFRHSLIAMRLTKDPVILIFLVGGTAGILGALVHMSVDALFLLPPVAQNFWMLIGLVTVAIKIALTAQNENQY